MSNRYEDPAIPPAVARKLAARVGDGDEAIAVGSRSGVIEWTNQAWTRVTGWAVERSVNKPVTRLLDEVGVEREVLDFIQSNYLAGRRSAVELPVQTPTGRSMWIHLEVEPCRDEAGEISDFLAVAHDITERREAEQVLPRQSDPAPAETGSSAVSRSEAAMLSFGLEAVRIGRLLGPITREVEALTQARRDDADEARLCDLGRRASRLAAQLSEVGEQGAATPCEVDVSNLARACASELAEAVPPCAQLDHAFAALPPLVHVDAARLSSLLLDMLQASLVALDGDWGTVSLSTGVTEPGHALRSEVYHRSYLPTLRDTQPRVFIELHDTAGSLDPAELRRLSKGLHPVPAPGRIFTLLRARALLAELGGELDVSSAPGCGTRVLMLLPVAEA